MIMRCHIDAVVCVLCLSFIPATAALADYADVVLGDNPVAYWRLNEKRITDPIVDRTGNVANGEFDDQGGMDFGIGGAIVGDTDTAVQFATAFGFGCGGACGRGSVPVGGVLDLGNTDSAQPITLEAWFKLLPSVNDALPPSAFPRLFHYNNFEKGQYAFGVVGNDNAGFEGARTVWGARGDGVDGGGVILAAATDAIPPSDDEEWFHFVAQLQQDTVRLFLNGEDLGELADSDPIAWQATQASIGARQQSDEVTVVQSFPGLIDELAVYNTILPLARIRAHYQAGLGQVEIDIDSLQDAIKAGTNNPTFDLNQDGKVDLADQTVFIRDIKKTWIGDANFDGEFNSTDFVRVFQVGEYEDNNPANPATIMNSKWDEGDWNADREFDSSDFVISFQEGGYEKGPRPPAAVVPEPSGVMLLILAFLGGAPAAYRSSPDRRD
jgi:hypothetical protein